MSAAPAASSAAASTSSATATALRNTRTKIANAFSWVGGPRRQVNSTASPAAGTSRGYSHAFLELKYLTSAIHRALAEYRQLQQDLEQQRKEELAMSNKPLQGKVVGYVSRLLFGYGGTMHQYLPSRVIATGALGGTIVLKNPTEALVNESDFSSARKVASVYDSIEVGEELSVRSVYKECRERARGRSVIDVAREGETEAYVELVSRKKVAGTRSGDQQPLAGAMIAVSDFIDVSGYLTRHGVSSPRFHKVPGQDDPLIRWMRKNGASCVGKLRCAAPFSYDEALSDPKQFHADPIGSALLGQTCHFTITRSLFGCPGLTSVESGVTTFKPTAGSLPTSPMREEVAMEAAKADSSKTTTAATPSEDGSTDSTQTSPLPINSTSSGEIFDAAAILELDLCTTAISATSVEDVQHMWELFAFSQNDGHAGWGSEYDIDEEALSIVPGSTAPASNTTSSDRFERDKDLAAVIAASSTFHSEGAEIVVGIPLSWIDTVAKFPTLDGEENDNDRVSGAAPDDDGPAVPANNDVVSSYANYFHNHLRNLLEKERQKSARSRRGLSLTQSVSRPLTRIEVVDTPLSIADDGDILRQYELLARYELARYFLKLTDSTPGGRGMLDQSAAGSSSKNLSAAVISGQATGLLEELPEATVSLIYQGLNTTDKEYIENKKEIVHLQRSIASAFADVDMLCTPLLCPQYYANINMRLLSLTLPFTMAGCPLIGAPLFPTAVGDSQLRPTAATAGLDGATGSAARGFFASLFRSRSSSPPIGPRPHGEDVTIVRSTAVGGGPVDVIVSPPNGILCIGELGRDSALIEDTACFLHSLGLGTAPIQ